VRGWRTASLLAVVVCYVAAWCLLPHEGFFINDSGCKLVQVEGLIRSGYADLSVPWPGQRLDPALQFRPILEPFAKVIDGRFFIYFPIPFAFLSSFPYRLLGPPGLLVLPFLAGLLLLPAIGALADLLPGAPWGRVLAVPAVALGTPLWFYSMTFWEHAPAVCLATWGLVFLLRFLAGRARRGAAIGALLLGLAVYLRDDMALLALALPVLPLLFGRRSPREPLLILGWFAASLVPLLALQWVALGTPAGIHGAAHNPFEQGLAAYLADRWPVFRALVTDAHARPWLSVVMALPAVVLLAVHPRVSRSPWMRLVPALLLWGAAWGGVAFAGHLTSDAPLWYLLSANGLFAVSPFLILAGLRECDEAGGEATDAARCAARVRSALWCIAVVYLLAYVCAAPPRHVRGIHWGSRLLLPLYPLLGVLAASTAARYLERLFAPAGDAGTAGANRLWRAGGATLVAAALTLSVAFQVYSLRLLGAREAFSARLNRAVAARPESVVVATQWSVPQEIAPVFYAKSIFLARSPGEFDRLLALLRAQGVQRILRIDAARGTSPPAANGLVLNDGLNFMSYRLAALELP
jgi:hypothetical protein